MQSTALLDTFQDIADKHTITFKPSVSGTGRQALEERHHANTQMKPTLQNKATFHPQGESIRAHNHDREGGDFHVTQLHICNCVHLLLKLQKFPLGGNDNILPLSSGHLSLQKNLVNPRGQQMTMIVKKGHSRQSQSRPCILSYKGLYTTKTLPGRREGRRLNPG